MKKLYLLGTKTVRLNRADPFVYIGLCDHFTKIGYDTTLIVPFGIGDKYSRDKDEIFKKYNIKSKFKIIEYPNFTKNKYFLRIQNYVFTFFIFIYFIIVKRLGKENIIMSFCYTKVIAVIHLKIIGFIKSKILFNLGTFKDSFITKFVVNNVDGNIIFSDFINKKIIERYNVSTKNLLLEKYISFNDIHTISKLKSKTSFLKNLQLPVNKKIVCYAGKVGVNSIEVKNIIKSSKYLSDDILVLIIGARKETGAYKYFDKYVKQNNFKNIYIKGHFPVNEYLKILSASDILVSYYSLTNPLSMHQLKPAKASPYLCAGKPLIFSDTPGLREFLTEDAVFFVEPDKPKKLAQMVKYILSNNVEATKKASNCIKLAEYYSAQKVIERIINFSKTC